MKSRAITEKNRVFLLFKCNELHHGHGYQYISAKLLTCEKVGAHYLWSLIKRSRFAEPTDMGGICLLQREKKCLPILAYYSEASDGLRCLWGECFSRPIQQLEGFMENNRTSLIPTHSFLWISQRAVQKRWFLAENFTLVWFEDAPVQRDGVSTSRHPETVIEHPLKDVCECRSVTSLYLKTKPI